MAVYISGVTVTSNPAPLAISLGGTGQSTASAAINALLPSQSAYSGLFLATDGTNVFWATGGGGGGGGPYAITGDVNGTIANTSGILTLTSVNGSPVTNQFQKVTVNVKGLVTATSDVTPSDIITALGYTPANGSGAGATGDIQFNTGGQLDGTSRLSWATATNTLTIGSAAADSTISAPKSLTLRVNGNSSLVIESTGVWKLGSNPGGVGQVLTSTSTGAPVWANVNGLLQGTPVITSQSIALQGDVIVTPTPYGAGNINPVATLPFKLASEVSAGFFRYDISRKGLITGTSAVQPSDIINAFGYTPVDQTGDTMTGPLYLSGPPQAALEAATKAYVDSIAQGVAVKSSATAATTGNINLDGIQTVDGVLLSSGDRVVVKNQTNPTENGVYVVDASSWTRSTDTDSGTELEGAFVFVQEGTLNSSTGWFQSTPAPIVVGTTDIIWTQFSGAGAYSAGVGLTLAGGEFSITSLGTPVSGFFGRFTTNTKGQVTTTGPATSGDIITALGYTPVSPGGLNKQIQYNDNGILGGSTNLVFDGTTLSLNDTLTSLSSSAHLVVVPADGAQDLLLKGGSAVQGTINDGSDAVVSGGAHGGGVTNGTPGTDPNTGLPIIIPPPPLISGNVVIQGGTTPGSVDIGGGVYYYNTNFSTGDVVLRTKAASGSGSSGAVIMETGDVQRIEVGGSGTVTMDITDLYVNSDAWYINSTAGLPGQVLSSNGPGNGPAWIDAGAGTVTSVSGDGGTTGLSLSGGPIINIGTLTLGGTLNVSNGGTGATTALQAATNILPVQLGNNGKVLTTDGSTASWQPAAGGGGGGGGTVTSIAISGGTTGLITTGGPVTTSGTITLTGTLGISNGGTGATSRATAINALLPTQSGNTGKYFRTNGTDAGWEALVATGAAGATGNFQYNNNGSFAAFSNLAWDDTISTMTLGPTGAGILNSSRVVSQSTYTISTQGALIVQNNGVRILSISEDGALGVGPTPLYGTAGQVLASTGPGSPPAWVAPASAPNPVGPFGAIQYNDAGVFSGATGVLITGGTALSATGKITAGSMDTAGPLFFTSVAEIESDDSIPLSIIAGSFPSAGTGNGGDIGITAGDAKGGGTTLAAGSVVISGGVGTANSSGGSIVLRTGSGAGSGSDGVFQVRTATTGTGVGTANRLTITSTGVWYVDPSNTPGGAGQALITDAQGIPMWRDVPAATLSGATGELQYNNAGILTGTTQIVFNGTNSLALGLSSGTFAISTPTGTTQSGGLSITLGDSTSTNGVGGSLSLSAGDATGSTSTGGSVLITAGTGTTTGGSVVFTTGGSEKVRISPAGAIGLGGSNFGTSGQAIVSNATSAPTWQNINVLADTVTFGTSIGGPKSITVLPASSGAAPTFTILGSNALTGNASGNIIIQAGSGTSGANSSLGGGLGLYGGNTGTNVQAAGGAVSIQGGNGGILAGSTGGVVTISGGISAQAAGSGGAVIFSTANSGSGTTLVERFRLNPSGSWSVGSTGAEVGASGQVLTSTGATTPPTWQTPTTQSSTFTSPIEAFGGASESVTTPAIRITNARYVTWLDNAAGLTNCTVIGQDPSNNFVIGTAALPRLWILQNGAWSLGTTTGSTGTAGFQITSNGASSPPTWGAASDSRLKTNIVYAPSAISKVNALQVRSFDWIASGEHVNYGFVAQELRQVEPTAVQVGDTWTIEQSKLIPTLTKALQEALALIEDLKTRVAALEAK